MRICLTSDWHIDAVTAGRRRIDELPAYLDAIAAAAPFDVILHLGDTFDPGHRMGPRFAWEALHAAKRLRGMCDHLVWIAGNHDVIETREVFTSISPLRALDDVKIAEVPTYHLLGGGDSAFGVLALPYTSRAYASTDAYHDDLGTAFGIAQNFRGKIPQCVIGHLSVPGAIMGSESREMARGRDIDFPAADVARLKPAFVANGHYHQAQIVKAKGVDIIIPGSPHRFTFGERDDDTKGFTVIEL